MTKKLSSILLAIGVIGTSTTLLSVAMAQQARGTVDPVGTRATKSTRSLDPVRATLSFAISEKQNSLLLLTNDKDEAQRIILACNKACLSLLTPPEQKASVEDFLQIDRYRPYDQKWQAIKQTPSRVSKLLGASDAAQDIARCAMDSVWADITGKNCPGPARIREQRVWLAKRCDEMRAKVAAALTSEERAEYNAIWEAYVAEVGS